MGVDQLKFKQDSTFSETTKAKAERISRLLEELRNLELSSELIEQINQIIERFNSFEGEDKAARRILNCVESELFQLLEKNAGIVAKNHYQNRWMALGISVFGIPVGVALGTALGNMAFMGAGLAIGLPIGMMIGAQKDKEAAKQGKQLNIELR